MIFVPTKRGFQGISLTVKVDAPGIHQWERRWGVQIWTFSTILSHGKEFILLGRKLNNGTSRGKELVPVQPDFVLIVLLCNLRPSIINSVPCDRIVQRAHNSLFETYLQGTMVVHHIWIGNTTTMIPCRRVLERIIKYLRQYGHSHWSIGMFR